MNKDFMIVYRERNHLCVDCGEPAAQRGPGSWFRYCEKCKEKRQAEQSSKQTLCWRCKNSVPDRYGERGCPWSRKRQPVEGWTAQERRLKVSNHLTVTSYNVRECPLFVEGRIK